MAIHKRADRHFKVEPVVGRGNAIVGALPVRHQDAIEAPFLAGDLNVEVTILRGVLAVDKVVGIHDGANMRLLHGRFERGEIDLAQRAFIDQGIGIVPQIFGVVPQKVLNGR